MCTLVLRSLSTHFTPHVSLMEILGAVAVWFLAFLLHILWWDFQYLSPSRYYKLLSN